MQSNRMTLQSTFPALGCFSMVTGAHLGGPQQQRNMFNYSNDISAKMLGQAQPYYYYNGIILKDTIVITFRNNFFNG